MSLRPIFDQKKKIPAGLGYSGKVTSGATSPFRDRSVLTGRTTGPLPGGHSNVLPNVSSKDRPNPAPLPDLSEGANNTFRSKAKKGAAATQRSGSLSAQIAGQKKALAGIKAGGSAGMGGPGSRGGTFATPEGSAPAAFDGPGPQSGSLVGNTQGGKTVGPGPTGRGRLTS